MPAARAPTLRPRPKRPGSTPLTGQGVTSPDRSPSQRHPRRALALAVGLLLLGATPKVMAVCDEDQTRLTSVIVRDTPATTARAQQVMRELVQKAIDTSEKLGSAQLLAEAAKIEIDEARAGALPRIDLTGEALHGSRHLEGIRQYQGGIGRIGLQVGGPLYDGGRVSELTRWRTELARAALDTRTGLQEQVALQTLSLALERSRYYKHGQVYRQHMRRLACLVDALERIVKLDGGRRSELVQARKTYQESKLSLDMAMNAKRQVELRLQRFVGEPLPRLEGLTTVLRDTPALGTVMSAALQSSEVQAIEAQARAANAFAGALAANRKPQVQWNSLYGHTSGATDATEWQVGIRVAIPLFDPASRHAEQAAIKRAEATKMQRADVVRERTARISDVHDQSESLARQADDIRDILADSNALRVFTLKQWQNLGRRSLFDVMSTERDHYGLRISHLNALHDRQLANIMLWSLGEGVDKWLSQDEPPAPDISETKE